MYNPEIQAQAIAFSNEVCKHPKYRKAFDAVEQLERYRGVKPKGLLVKGKTGTGKSFLAEQIIKSRPAVDEDNITTHPILYLNIAEGTKTVGGVVSMLLHELGDPRPFNGQIPQRMKTLNELMLNLKVELVILDEIQDWIPKSGVTPKSEIYLFFKGCLNSWKVPFLFLGTEESEKVFAEKELKDRCLPTQILPQFSCLNRNATTNFGALLHTMLTKLPRKTTGMNFVKKVIKKNDNPEIPDKMAFVLVNPNKGLLLRLCLASKGHMRVLSDLLTGCIYQAKEDEKVDIDTLRRSFDAEVKDRPYGNPFDELMNVRSVIKALKKENLYEKQ